MREFLKRKPSFILESLSKTIPEKLQKVFNLENWGWIECLIGENGILEITNSKVRDEFLCLNEFYKNKEDEWKNTEDLKKRMKLNKDMDWANDRKNTIKKRPLIDFLATHTVIPKYGFPVDVVELTPLSHILAAKTIQLERDLRIAISEFAPGNQIVAKGYIWESAGLRVVRDRKWPINWYAICPDCKQFYIQKGTIDENLPLIPCENCKKPINKVEKFTTPIFGFVTSREEPKKPGESRPRREFTTRPYFINYKEPEEKNFQIEKLGVKCKYSSDGELAVICKGKKGRGFIICFDCGASFKEMPKGKHKKPTGEECFSRLRSAFHFGHTFKTDVLTISLESYVFAEALRGKGFWDSLLYSILEGTSLALGIRRQDLDGCLYPHESKMSLVLFDNVPGGAGHVKRIMDEQNLYEIFNSAFNRVKNCACGPETSCYGCLRNYQNQYCHEQLKRGIVLEFLKKNLL